MSLSCANPLLDYSNSDGCAIPQYAGGIRNIVIFQGELPVDPSDGNEIQAMIEDGTAVVLRDLKVGLPEPTPITTTSMVSCEPEAITNYDRTITVMDQKANAENVAFWNSANASNGFVAEGILLHNCDVDRVNFIDKKVRFSGGLIIPDDNNAEPQHFSFTGNFRSKSDALIFDTPAGVFDVE